MERERWRERERERERESASERERERRRERKTEVSTWLYPTLIVETILRFLPVVVPRSGVSICTFVLVNQVSRVPCRALRMYKMSERGGENDLEREGEMREGEKKI